MRGELRDYLRYTSWPIIAAMIALMVIGVLAIRVSEKADPYMEGHAAKQTAFACVALAAFLAAMVVPYQRLGPLAYGLFALTLCLLAIVLALPAGRGGCHRWIDLKIVQVQPSELAKLSFIVLLAWYLRYGNHYRRLRGLILPFVLTFLPAGLVLMEPDLGTSLLFLPTMYFMLFMAGAKARHLAVIVLLGAAAVLLPAPRQVELQEQAEAAKGFNTLRLGPVTFHVVDKSLDKRHRPYVPLAYCRLHWRGGKVYDLMPLSLRFMPARQAARIEGWLRQDDARIVLDKGYHLHRSKMVLASGQLTGRGNWQQVNAYFRMLPDDHTDFIFSVIGGQWGFLGCLAVLGLYAVIFVFGMEIATATYEPFGRLLAVGVLALLFSQLIINVGMTMGLMPITGMTLPLVSYGGSSLVVNCAAMGLLVNVGQRRPILLGRRPFEHGEKKEKPPQPYGPLAGGSDFNGLP